MLIHNRPMRRDRRMLVHMAYRWGEASWEPICEAHTVMSRRDTDEPADTLPTCLFCWAIAIR